MAGAQPRIIVMGAGSVGCFIGGAWLAAGCDIAFLGRDTLRNELAEHGIGLSDPDGWSTHLTPNLIRYETKPAALKKADIIALTVKATGIEAAAKEIHRHAAKGATVVAFQNGVSAPEMLAKALPKQDVVAGIVPYNVVRLGKGRFHRASWGDIAAAPTPATEALSMQIGDRPGRVTLREDMASIAWGKLLLNLNNAINALSGKTLLEELSDRDYRRVLAAAQIEALTMLDAAGIEPAAIGKIGPKLMPHIIGAPDWLFNKAFLKIQKIDPKGRSSMADDFAAGRKTEVDFLNGEVVKLARRLGREAPVNSKIVNLVRQAEAGVEHVWSAERLRAHILEGHRGAKGFGY